MSPLAATIANVTAFYVYVACYLLIAYSLMPRAYRYGPVVTFLVTAVFGAALPYTLTAVVWEGRWPWPLSGQYASAWGNDLILLPALAGILSVMCRALPREKHRSKFWLPVASDWPEPVWWPPVAFGLAIGVGCYFQFVVDRVYPEVVAWSPTHAAHSFLCAPVLAYMLLRGAPGLFAGPLGFRAITGKRPQGIVLSISVVVILVVFAYMYPLLDIHLLHSYPWDAHGPYDWRSMRLYHRLTPNNPGWVPRYLMSNAGRYGAHPLG